MNEIIYYVYDGANLLAGFAHLAMAILFVENWRPNSDVEVDLVDANTGEVVDTWVNGEWEGAGY